MENDRNVHNKIAYANGKWLLMLGKTKHLLSNDLSQLILKIKYNWLTENLWLNFIKTTTSWKSGNFSIFWKSRDYWKENCGICDRNNS